VPAQMRPDIGADFSMGDLLRPDTGTSAALGPVTEDPALLAFDQSERLRSPQRPAAAAPARTERAAENPAAAEAFCRGAGIDAAGFPADAQGRLLHLAGLMLRETLVGLKGLALAQRDIRDRQRIEVGREDPQRIGLTGLPVEDLLVRLLQGHDAHRLDAVQWVRETLASARQHDQAAAQAMQSALADFIARLDPAALSPGATRGGPTDAQIALLRERFQSITGSAPGELPHLFSEAFARAFALAFKGG